MLLALAAAGGLVMAGIRFMGERSPPAALAMLHGFLAAAAVTLLLYAAMTVGLPRMALVALALFLIAAGGGAILNLNHHWKQLQLPKWLILSKRAGNTPREVLAAQREVLACQRCGSNSSIRPAGCVGSRVSTSLM